MKEEVDKELNVATVLTQNVAMLASAVASLNAAVLVLLADANHRGITVPDWKTKQDAEKEVNLLLTECINLVNNLKETDVRPKGANKSA